MKEKRDPKARALSAFKYWIKRCQDEGISKSEMRKMVNQVVNHAASQVVNQVVNHMVNQEEEEKVKRENPPHTPSKERSEKEGEEARENPMRACEENSSMPADKLVESCQCDERPTLEQILEYVKYHGKKQYTDELVREWYEQCVFDNWKDSKGNPIKNWKSHLRIWRDYHAIRKKLADPDRIPDARMSRRNSEEESARQRQNDADAIAQQIIDARRKRNDNV